MTRTSLSIYMSLLLTAAPTLSYAAPKSGGQPSKKCIACVPEAPAAPAAVNPFARIAALRGGAAARPVQGAATSHGPSAAPKAERVDPSPERGVALREALEKHAEDARRLDLHRSEASSRVSRIEDRHQDAKDNLRAETRRISERERAQKELDTLRPKLQAARDLVAETKSRVPESMFKKFGKGGKGDKGDKGHRGHDEEGPREDFVSRMSRYFGLGLGGRPLEVHDAVVYLDGKVVEPDAEERFEAPDEFEIKPIKYKSNDKDKDGKHSKLSPDQVAYNAWRNAKRALEDLEGSIERAESTMRLTKPSVLFPKNLKELEFMVEHTERELTVARAELSDLEKKLSAANAAHKQVSNEYDRWEAAAQQVAAERVYTVLDKLKASPPKVDARWNAQFYSVPKQAAVRNADNRDVISVVENDGVLRFAVADGSSNGDFAGQWAQLVAHRYTGHLKQHDDSMPGVDQTPALGDRAALKAYLEPVHEAWWRMVQGAGPIARRAVQTTRGLTTLVGVELRPNANGGYDYRAEGAGDTNLFILRKGKSKVEAWPMKSAAEFNRSPAALSFALETNTDSTWKVTEGTLQPGDEIFAATDAVAKWVLLGGAKANERLQRLAAVTDAKSYAALIKEVRAATVDDDSTFARFVVPGNAAVAAAPAKAPRAKKAKADVVESSAKDKE